MSNTSDPASVPTLSAPASTEPRLYPKVTITYCTQCKWMLRAAYHAQELLSTFSTSLAEIALRPGTGGIYTIHLEAEVQVETHTEPGAGDRNGTGSEGQTTIRNVQLWDRKAMGGFPETKILKRLIRDVIDPERGLGHVDRVSSGTDGKGDAAAPGSGSMDIAKTSHAEATHTTNGDAANGQGSGDVLEDLSLRMLAAHPVPAHEDGTRNVVEATPTSVNGFVAVRKSDGKASAVSVQTNEDDEEACDCAKP